MYIYCKQGQFKINETNPFAKVFDQFNERDSTQRAQLIKTLQRKLEELRESTHQPINNQFNAVPINNEKQIVQLRLKLIGDCSQLSVERIEHLEQIFKHYCTHIFKIGKHMTFQRLQYEKVHLTLDRLCVLLKDFGLNSAKIDGVDQQIIDKQQIVRNFKRISKNCRDLGFEQFIALLQKLAIVYFDQKAAFQQKSQKNRRQRQMRIAEYKKKMKQKNKAEQSRIKILRGDGPNKQTQLNLLDEDEKNEQQKQNDNENDNEESEKKHDQHEENDNDDLVQKMMEDDKIQNPSDEIKKAIGLQTKKSSKQNTSKILGLKKEITQPQFELTPEQKIQFYYQLIGVDNVRDFRNKMSQLGLPLFKQYQPHAKPQQKRSTSTKTGSEMLKVIVENNEKQDERRLIELRQKINIKRQRDKHLYTPTMTKQQYEQRKKKREEKQLQIMKQMNVSKIGTQYSTDTKQKQRQKNAKKIQLMDKQLSLDMLNHISFDDLKNRFDPKKFVHSDQSDKIFLNQYGADIDATNKLYNRKKAHSNSRIEALTNKTGIRQNTGLILQRKRTSSNIVQDFKKRAYEMQVKQFHKQAQFTRFVNQMKKKQKNGRNQPPA